MQGGGAANHGGDESEHYGGDAHELDSAIDDEGALPVEAPPEAPNFVPPVPENVEVEGDHDGLRRARVEERYNLRRTAKQKYTHKGIIREEVGLHITVNKALKKMPKAALREMYREMRQMLTKEVFEPRHRRRLPKPQLKSVIRSSMFLKEKYLATGEFDKLKARLVAGGNTQDKSLYEDVSSPTVSTQAAFMVAGIAALEGRHVATLDIGGAYLNADMSDHEVLMRLDPKLAMILTKLEPSYEDFLDEDGTMIVKLKKALYGCVESAKLWYEHLCKTLEDMGFVRNPLDICVFNKVTINRVTKKSYQCTVIAHVDDLKITCVDEREVERERDRRHTSDLQGHQGATRQSAFLLRHDIRLQCTRQGEGVNGRLRDRCNGVV